MVSGVSGISGLVVDGCSAIGDLLLLDDDRG
jgi:hypothetical protein